MISISANYYVARISVCQCFVDVRVNDVPLLRQDIDGDMTVEIPVNFLIERSGIQALSVYLRPAPVSFKLSQAAQCRIEIWRYDCSGQEIIPIGQVCNLNLAAKDNGMLLDLLVDRKVFYADVSYQMDRWSDCLQINDRKGISSRVAAMFQNVGKLLASKQYESYLELVKNREINICSALSLDEKETLRRSKMLFECLDGGFSFVPIKGSKVLQFYADGRAATVLDHDDMKSALRFANEETGEMIAIDLLLGIKKGNIDFEII